jgi:hypothetical protein
MSQCISEPISWLRLERYRLLELAPAERGQVDQHLERCELCRACLARIDAGVALAPLRPRPLRPSVRARRLWTWGVFATATAAAVLLSVLPGGPGLPPPGPALRVKGGELALGLVRLRDGSIAHDPAHFARGDRFKVQLTCPPDMRGNVEVVVFQAGQTFFPLAPYRLADCGNLRILPGAFSLEGDADVTVCAVVVQAGAVDRAALRAGGVRALPALSVCVPLSPSR